MACSVHETTTVYATEVYCWGFLMVTTAPRIGPQPQDAGMKSACDCEDASKYCCKSVEVFRTQRRGPKLQDETCTIRTPHYENQTSPNHLKVHTLLVPSATEIRKPDSPRLRRYLIQRSRCSAYQLGSTTIISGSGSSRGGRGGRGSSKWQQCWCKWWVGVVASVVLLYLGIVVVVALIIIILVVLADPSLPGMVSVSECRWMVIEKPAGARSGALCTRRHASMLRGEETSASCMPRLAVGTSIEGTERYPAARKWLRNVPAWRLCIFVRS